MITTTEFSTLKKYVEFLQEKKIPDELFNVYVSTFKNFTLDKIKNSLTNFYKRGIKDVPIFLLLADVNDIKATEIMSYLKTLYNNPKYWHYNIKFEKEVMSFIISYAGGMDKFKSMTYKEFDYFTSEHNVSNLIILYMESLQSNLYMDIPELFELKSAKEKGNTHIIEFEKELRKNG